MTTAHALIPSALLLVLAPTLALAPAARAADHDHGAAAIPGATKAVETDAALRDLWLGHAFWVRAVVAETLAHNEAAAAVAEKEVVANARQIAAAIEPFYGKDASEALFGLLAGHYGAVKQYLEATAAGRKDGQDLAFHALVANAGEIADFLSKANPHLGREALNALLLAHGGHHVEQIRQVHAKDHAGEAVTWTVMKDHMYVLADALAAALVKQFPDRF